MSLLASLTCNHITPISTPIFTSPLPLMMYLIFITNKLSHINYLKYIISLNFCMSEVLIYDLVLRSRFHRLKLQCWLGWIFIERPQGNIYSQVYSCCCPNSIPCNCRTECPISLLTVRVPLSFYKTLHSLPQGSIHLQGSNAT